MTTWIFEPGHTEAEFRARHMMVAWVRGLFKDIHGELELDWERCLEATFAGEIDAAGIWTGEPQRDEHLRSADFFDVENHPKIGFSGRFTETHRGDRLQGRGRADDPRRDAHAAARDRLHRRVEDAVVGRETRTAASCAGSASRRPPGSTATTSASPGRTSYPAVESSSATRSNSPSTSRRSTSTTSNEPARSSTTCPPRRGAERNARLRPRHRVRVLPDPGRRRSRGSAGDGPAGRPPWLRPARSPGPSLPAGASRLAGAAGCDPRPDRPDPRLPGRRQPAAAPSRRVREGGGDARPAQRRALRGRSRRRRIPGAGARNGRPGAHPRARASRRSRRRSRSCARAGATPARCASTAATTSSRARDPAPSPRTRSASGWAPRSRARSRSPGAWPMAGPPR